MDLAITALVTLFLLFYFVRDKYRMLRVLQQLMPLSPRENEQVRNNIRDTLGAVVFCRLAVAVVQGTSGGLLFWWLGLPSPTLWGAVMAILVTLPLFGAALIWIPAAVSLAFPVHAGGSWCILWIMMSDAPTANGVWVTEPTRVTSVGAT